MQKWEYINLPMVVQNEMIVSEEFLSYFQSSALVLNIVGQDSWELVAVDNGVAYFKRPVVDEELLNRRVGGFGLKVVDESP